MNKELSIKNHKKHNSLFLWLNSNAFTIVELLVAISVIAVMGAIVTEIFARSLRGGNKAQIIASIKQNGQATLEAMDKTIRNSDEIVCPVILVEGSQSVDTVAVVKDGNYTRFRYNVGSPTMNGYILRDNPAPQSGELQETFLLNICSNVDHARSTPVSITDRNTKTGVSVAPGVPNIFTRNKKEGFNDNLTISFALGPGVQAPQAVAGQIDPVTFTTTIQLR